MGKGSLALAALAAAACAGGEPWPAQAAAAPAPGAAAGEAADLPSQRFVCSDGRLVEIRVDAPAGVAIVVRDGAETLFQAEAGRRPARFVSGTTTLALARGEARFSRLGRPLARCAELPAAPVRGVLTGTLMKLDRMALPEGTRAKVMLVDAARADAPAVEAAAAEIVTAGNQVPLHFLIRYDPDRVTPRGRTWRLSARVTAPDGRLLYVTDQARFLLEGRDAEPPVELLLVPVRRGS